MSTDDDFRRIEQLTNFSPFWGFDSERVPFFDVDFSRITPAEQQRHILQFVRGYCRDLSTQRDQVFETISKEFLLPRCDCLDEEGINEILSLAGLMHLLEPNGDKVALPKSIGRLLAMTREDESITSGIVSKDSNLPLSVWSLVLERAWKQKYFVANRGPDAVYYLLQNAQALQEGIRSTPPAKS